MTEDRCSFDNLVPTLDKLIWCVVILVSVAALRLLLSLLVTEGLKRELPSSMKFPSWEAPVLLVEYIAICSSAFLAVSTMCDKWLAVGCVLLVFWPVFFLVLSGVLLGRHVRSAHMEYEWYDAEAEPPTLPPSFSEMKKSLDGAKGIVPSVLKMRAWYLAAEVRGWWKDGTMDAFGWKFLVGDYVGSAWFFGIWMMAKKILFLASTTSLDGRANAILCIVVQTFDMFLVLGLRPYVSKLTCISQCLAAVTNWLAILNLGLLLWPGLTPLQLGEMTVFVLAIFGTGLATLVASMEAMMSTLILIWNILASFGACMGISGTFWMATQAEILRCCFGIPIRQAIDSEDGPIYLTSIACDWDQSQEPTDVTQSMGWMPISDNGLPQPHYPYDPNKPGLSPQQDPAVLAAYYRQLADYHQMLSMKTNTDGRTNSNPSMISPVSMSTAPTNFYNPTTLFSADEPKQLQQQTEPVGTPHHAVRELPRFGDSQDLQSSPHIKDPKVSVSASLYHPVQSLPAATKFSRRSAPGDVRDDYVDGAPLSSVPPPLSGQSTQGSNGMNGRGIPTLPLASMPIQSLSQRVASVSPRSRSTDPYWRTVEDAPSTINGLSPNGRSNSASPSKMPMTRSSILLTSPPMYDYRDDDYRDDDFFYNPSLRFATSSMPQRASHSPRKLPDRDSPQNLQSHTSKRTEELREGITRRAEVLRQQLSTDRSMSPSSASNSPVYARGSSFGPVTHLSSSRDRLGNNNDGLSARAGLVPGLTSSHLIASPMSPSASALTRNDAESARRDFMSRLEDDTSGLRQHLLDDIMPINLPPAPDYPPPAAPQLGRPASGYGSDNDWDTGFG